MGHIKLTIITPTTQYHAEDGDLVTVTSKSGSEGFMAGHVPTVVAIVPGPLRYRLISENETNKEPEWRNFFASVGYAEVSPTEVMVVVTAAELVEHIDVERAQRALERAEKRINNPAATERDLIHGKHAIRRAKARIHVVELYGHMLQKMEQKKKRRK
ncbi:MAG: ATP synthase F1 subunit epsilon [Fastidiosipilaceae bacterium]|jgi:F-type H+-transporting ATPase subunit epsilon|nr:ATP synthase F1 subunit epsilon [Clostridiaceae bacterium]